MTATRKITAWLEFSAGANFEIEISEHIKDPLLMRFELAKIITSDDFYSKYFAENTKVDYNYPIRCILNKDEYEIEIPFIESY